MDNFIMVSVVMLCYNHERFIRRALESVLSQKTQFKYEIIIHDDASTDGSAVIIQEYVQKYPNIIKPILQRENQYSKKIGIMKTFIDPEIRGKYVAYCECDDYWCNDEKLQKQVEFLENNVDYSGVTHNCYIVDETDKVSTEYGVYRMCRSHTYTLHHLAFANIYPGQTAALLCRRSALQFDSDEQKQDYYKMRLGVGDVRRYLHLLLSSNIYYSEDIMSVHRVIKSTGDSWTARTKNQNMSYRLFVGSIDMRKYVKKHSDNTYKNYYSTFSSGAGGIIKYLLNKTSDNKIVYEKLCDEKGGLFKLIVYLVGVGICSVPTLFLRFYDAKICKRVLGEGKEKNE